MNSEFITKQHYVYTFKELIEKYKLLVKNMQHEIIDIKDELVYISQILKQENIDQDKLPSSLLKNYILKLNKYIYDIELVLQSKKEPINIVDEYRNGVASSNKGCHDDLISGLKRKINQG